MHLVMRQGRSSCGPLRQLILCQSMAWRSGLVTEQCLPGSWSLLPRLESMVLCCCARVSTHGRPGAHDRVGHDGCMRTCFEKEAGAAQMRRKSSWGTACRTGNGSRKKTFSGAWFFSFYFFAFSLGMAVFRGWQWKITSQRPKSFFACFGWCQCKKRWQWFSGP